MLGTERLPVRLLLPAGALKLTTIVQVPPTATVWPEQVSVPLLNAVLPPPFVTAAVANVTGAVPTVSVTVLETFPDRFPKARVVPVKVPGDVADVKETVPLPIVSVSVAVLLAGFGSVTPAGTAMVALLVDAPVGAFEGMLPVRE